MRAQGRSRMIPWLWPEQVGGEQSHFWRESAGEKQVWGRMRNSGLAVLSGRCLWASVVWRSEVRARLEGHTGVWSAEGAAK